MNPIHFLLGFIAGNNDKTIKEIIENLNTAFKDTVFEEMPKDVPYKCIVRLLMDAMIEMSGEHNFVGMNIEDVLKKFEAGEMDQNKIRLTKKN